MTSPQADAPRPRLLVVASTYPRWPGDPEPGFVHELSKRLATTFDVTVVCPGAAGAAGREMMEGVCVRRFRYAPRPLETLVNDGGITTNLRRSPWKFMLLPSFLAGMALGLLAASRAHRPDVVHAHWLVPQGWLAALVLRRHTPLLVTSHGADLFAWRRWPFRTMKRFVLGRATAATVVSRPMVDEMLQLGVTSSSIDVAPMGVDLEHRFTVDESSPRARSEILFVGRLVGKKGLRHLISAMPAILAEVPDAKLTVAGFGPELAARMAQARDAGVGEAVRFVGAVPQADLPGMYRRAAVFVAPFVEDASGDRDGLGLVSVEAAGCGCPIVISDVHVVHDVFGAEDAVFARPGDPADIADKVITVLRHGGPASASMREGLVERFDWSRVARNYGAILSRIMKPKAE